MTDETISQALAILRNNAWKRKTSGMKLAAMMGTSPQSLCNYRTGYKPMTTTMAARIIAAYEALTAPVERTNNEDGN